jgi:hypothetical protein
MTNVSKYSGGGILFYKYDKQKDDIMFYLFESSFYGSLNDLGGLKDKTDFTFMDTAVREAMEESGNLLHIANIF